MKSFPSSHLGWLAVLSLGVAAAACGSSSSGNDLTGTGTGGSDSGGAGGTGGGAGGSTSGPTVDQACTDLATAVCAKRDSCVDNLAVHQFGSDDACRTREKLRCTISQSAPMTGTSPAISEACATSLPGASCTDFLAPKSQVCPQQVGPLATAAACGFNAQCQSGFCSVPDGSSCGACAALPAAGDDCTATGTCGPTDLRCVAADATSTKQICATIGDSGAACDRKMAECGAGLLCVGADAKMNQMGTCMAAATTPGADCDAKNATAAGCDRNLGLYCDPTTSKCVPALQAMPGAPCGTTKGVLTVCIAASNCIGEASGMGTCVAYAADGAACDTAMGPTCTAPARCVAPKGATAGVCTLPSGTCM